MKFKKKQCTSESLYNNFLEILFYSLEYEMDKNSTMNDYEYNDKK